MKLPPINQVTLRDLHATAALHDIQLDGDDALIKVKAYAVIQKGLILFQKKPPKGFVGKFFGKLFSENEKAWKNRNWDAVKTDEQLWEAVQLRFGERGTVSHRDVVKLRWRYNRGQFTNGRPPRRPARRYFRNGKEVIRVIKLDK